MSSKRSADVSRAVVKRKRQSITLTTKIEIVNAVERGERPIDVARRLGLPPSSVRTIIQKKDVTKKMAAVSPKHSEMRITKERPEIMEKMEKRLAAWLQDHHVRNIPVSLGLVQEKALGLYDDLKKQMPPEEAAMCQEFKAARGWFHRFQKRHGFKNVKVLGGAASADTQAAEKFPEYLEKIIKEGGYSPKQVFNMDESGLFWKKIPTRTYNSVKEKTPPGLKAAKERVTLLFGANASGDKKLKPLLVHRSENPRALKNVVKALLPVVWKSHQKAWITKQIFQEYLVDHAIPELRDYCKEENMDFKILLILDNASAHDLDFQALCPQIRVVFLPPKTTLVLQPLDQGVIACFMANYHKETLQKLIAATGDGDKTVEEFWKDFTILDAVYIIGREWRAVTQQHVNSAWRTAYPHALYEFEGYDETQVHKELAQLTNEARINVKEEDLEELIEPHSVALTNEELEELGRQSFEEESAEKEGETAKKLTAAVVKKLLEHIDAAEEIVMQHDPFCDRAIQFSRIVQGAASCYKLLLEKKNKKHAQPALDANFSHQKQSVPFMDMPAPGPSRFQKEKLEKEKQAEVRVIELVEEGKEEETMDVHVIQLDEEYDSVFSDGESQEVFERFEGGGEDPHDPHSLPPFSSSSS